METKKTKVLMANIERMYKQDKEESGRKIDPKWDPKQFWKEIGKNKRKVGGGSWKIKCWPTEIEGGDGRRLHKEINKSF